MKRLIVIMAVLKKEFTLLVRYPTWIIQLSIFPLIIPLMYILNALGLSGPDRSGMKVFAQNTGTENFVAYIIVGVMMWMIVNSVIWSFGGHLREEQTLGTLESNWLSPIKKFDILIGAAGVSIFTTMFTSVIAMIEYKFIYGATFTGSPLSWLCLLIILISGLYGFASCYASLVLWAKETNSCAHVARGLVMILCGISFPVDVMPVWMQTLGKALPFTYGIKAAREVMVFGKTLFEARENLLICLGIGIIYLILGRVLFYITERTVRLQGSIGRY